jgi:hypothetical protein
MFARNTFTAAVAAAILAPLVSAHGYLRCAEVDGERYCGPIPNQGGGAFAIRSVNSVDPVKGSSNPDLACGRGSTNDATLVADVNPGATIKFNWSNGEGGAWPHNTGPILTYMAPCGDGGCANFDAANAQFFKIDEKGRHDGNGPWFQADIFQNFDATTDVTIPTNLPAGEYLVRHEIIGLHLGNVPGGAEFYPSCFQVRLGQSEVRSATLPPADKSVTFPGGYTDDEPGILFFGVYDPNSAYDFPGPELVSTSTDENNDDNNGDNSPPATEEPTPTGSIVEEPATSTSLPSCGQQSKKKVKRSQSAFRHIVDWKTRRSGEWKRTTRAPAVKREVVRPVVMSRIMRAIN